MMIELKPCPFCGAKTVQSAGLGTAPMEVDFPWISSDSDGFCHRGERKEDTP